MTRVFLFLIFLIGLSACSQPKDKGMDLSEAINERHFIIDPLDNRVSFILDGEVLQETLIDPSNIKRIGLSSTTQLAYFSHIQALDKVVGTPWLSFVEDDYQFENELIDYTKGAALDMELIIASEPDVFLYDLREKEIVKRLEDSGILCIPFYEHLAKSPLQRIEWLELVGLLCGKEKEARDLVKSMKGQYIELKTDNKLKGKVLFASYYQGTWSAAGGESLLAQLIRDAGAEYVVTNKNSGSFNLQIEELLVYLEQADHLGMINQGMLSKQDILAMDERLTSDDWGSVGLFYVNSLEADYFGKGILEPEIMLQDLQRIFKDHTDEGNQYFEVVN